MKKRMWILGAVMLFAFAGCANRATDEATEDQALTGTEIYEDQETEESTDAVNQYFRACTTARANHPNTFVYEKVSFFSAKRTGFQFIKHHTSSSLEPISQAQAA